MDKALCVQLDSFIMFSSNWLLEPALLRASKSAAWFASATIAAKKGRDGGERIAPVVTDLWVDRIQRGRYFLSLQVRSCDVSDKSRQLQLGR